MKKLLPWPKQFVLTQAGRMCFGVAAGAFLAAALGFVVNQYLVGWIATGGMIAIGLLYVAMGLLHIRIAKPKESANSMRKYFHSESGCIAEIPEDLKEKTWNFPSDFHNENQDPRGSDKLPMTRG